MKSFKQYLEEVKKPTGDLKNACWKGYTAVGTKEKNGRTVPNCVPEEVELDEASKDNPRHPMHQSDPSLYKKTTKGIAKNYATHTGKFFSNMDFTLDYKRTNKEAPRYKNEEIEHFFDIIEEMVEAAASEYNIDSELLWERLESVSDEELIEESAAWQRSAGKDPKGGLNRKGIASYRREHPGSKLSMAVTTKPSKLKKGSKAANRRKSFCARMGGMKKRLTSAKTSHDPNSRINKALRKWNC
jgi:hypothetical protein